MTIKALSSTAEKVITYPGSETSFTIGSITGRAMAWISDQTFKFVPDPDNPEAAGAEFRPNLTNLHTVMFGLRGWDNFLNAEGTPVQFISSRTRVGDKMVDCVSDTSLDRLPHEVIKWLAERIKEFNSLTPDEEKNSEEQS
jgi:hypothetical protein